MALLQQLFQPVHGPAVQFFGLAKELRRRLRRLKCGKCPRKARASDKKRAKLLSLGSTPLGIVICIH